VTNPQFVSVIGFGLLQVFDSTDLWPSANQTSANYQFLAPGAYTTEQLSNGNTRYSVNLGTPNSTSRYGYYIQACVTSPSQCTLWSETYSATVQKEFNFPPAPPTVTIPRYIGAACGATDLGDTTIQIDWTHNTLDTSVMTNANIQWSSDGGTTWNAVTLNQGTLVGTTIGNHWTFTTTPNAIGMPTSTEVLFQVRTYGIHPDPSDWSSSVPVTVLATPTISFTSEDSITTGVYVLHWTYNGTAIPSSIGYMEISIYSGASTSIDNLLWSGRVNGSLGEFRLPVALGRYTQYTITASASTSLNIRTCLATMVLNVDFEPPYPMYCNARWLESLDAVSLDIFITDDTSIAEIPDQDALNRDDEGPVFILPQRYTIYRAAITNATEPLNWVLLAEGLPITTDGTPNTVISAGSFIDRFPPLNRFLIYRVVSGAEVEDTHYLSYTPSTAYTFLRTRSITARRCSDNLNTEDFLNRFNITSFPTYWTGEFFMTSQIDWEFEMIGSTDHRVRANSSTTGGEVVQFAGASLPRFFQGRSRELTLNVSFSADISGRQTIDATENPSLRSIMDRFGGLIHSSLQDWENFFQVARVVTYRDHLGNYLLARIYSGNINYGIQSFSQCSFMLQKVVAPGLDSLESWQVGASPARAVGVSLSNYDSLYGDETAYVSRDIFGEDPTSRFIVFPDHPLDLYPDGWISSAAEQCYQQEIIDSYTYGITNLYFSEGV